MISFRDQNTFVTIIYIFRLERCFNFLARPKTKINKAYIHKKPCVNLLTNETYILQYHFLHRFNCSNSFNNSLKCKLPEYLRSTCRISSGCFNANDKFSSLRKRKRKRKKEKGRKIGRVYFHLARSIAEARVHTDGVVQILDQRVITKKHSKLLAHKLG